MMADEFFWHLTDESLLVSTTCRKCSFEWDSGSKITRSWPAFQRISTTSSFLNSINNKVRIKKLSSSSYEGFSNQFITATGLNHLFSIYSKLESDKFRTIKVPCSPVKRCAWTLPYRLWVRENIPKLAERRHPSTRFSRSSNPKSKVLYHATPPAIHKITSF